MLNPINFLKETKAELSKVIWPTKLILFNHSLVVIISILIAIFIIGLFDYGLLFLTQKLILRIE